MKTVAVILALCITTFSAAFGQSELERFVAEAKHTVEQGNARFNKELLLQGMSMFERALSTDPENLLLMYHLSYAEYRLMTYYFSRETDQFDPLADKTIARLKHLLDKKPGWPEVQSLLSGIYGLKIGRNWAHAMTLGPQANSLAAQAVETDQGNPRAWLMHGTQKFNTPAFFGGSMKEAITSYRTAINLFEEQRNSDPLAPSWGYTDALIWLGRAYEQEEQYDEALAMYRKVLEIEPEFAWVKHNLLPALEKTIAGTE